MKTAISIPDTIFKAGERLRKQMGLSRSEFYSRAIDRFIKRHDQAWVTEQLNKNLAERPDLAEIDPFVEEAARQVFERLDEEERAVSGRRRRSA
jgi:hypothetical protein